jgi:hypothetical protein
VNWTEGPRGPLEGKLRSVFAALEQRAIADDQRAEEAARRAEELRREQAEREAHARRLRIEQARGDRLAAEVDAWELGGRSRSYAEALREKLPSLSRGDQARIAAWCDWVEDWANRADPAANPSLIAGLEDEKEPFDHGAGRPTTFRGR